MKFFFHPDHEPRVFDLDEPPEGWFDNPSEFGLYTAPSREQIEEMAMKSGLVATDIGEPIMSEPEASTKIDERAMLIDLAESAGIELDKRWGIDRIKSAIEGRVSGDGA